MKSEQPWQAAKREADNRERRQLMAKLSADAAREKASRRSHFNPMAIAWGNTDPVPPKSPKGRKR